MFTNFDVPDDAVGCGFHEAVRGALSHHMVIKDGVIANYHPYPPTPWNGSPRDIYGTPGPYEDAIQDMPIFEENGPDDFKGVDIMRAVRSFDPCLPCGVHMYLGNGKSIADAALADVRGHPWLTRRRRTPRASGTRLDDRAVGVRLAALDEQLAQLETTPGPIGELALATVSGLAEIYGQALARALDLVDPALLERMLGDELIGHLLVLHGIHPAPISYRTSRVIEGMRVAVSARGARDRADRREPGWRPCACR